MSSGVRLLNHIAHWRGGERKGATKEKEKEKQRVTNEKKSGEEGGGE
jgi:hypothetical protein